MLNSNLHCWPNRKHTQSPALGSGPQRQQLLYMSLRASLDMPYLAALLWLGKSGYTETIKQEKRGHRPSALSKNIYLLIKWWQVIYSQTHQWLHLIRCSQCLAGDFPASFLNFKMFFFCWAGWCWHGHLQLKFQPVQLESDYIQAMFGQHYGGFKQ